MTTQSSTILYAPTPHLSTTSTLATPSPLSSTPQIPIQFPISISQYSPLNATFWKRNTRKVVLLQTILSPPTTPPSMLFYNTAPTSTINSQHLAPDIHLIKLFYFKEIRANLFRYIHSCLHQHHHRQKFFTSTALVSDISLSNPHLVSKIHSDLKKWSVWAFRTVGRCWRCGEVGGVCGGFVR